MGFKNGQSLITPDGVWMGKDWLRVARGLGDNAGVLLREKEIAGLRERCAELEKTVALESDQLQKAQAQRSELEGKVRAQQDVVNQLHRAVASQEASQESRKASIEMMSSRGAEIANEIEALNKQVEEDREAVSKARSSQESQVEAMAVLNSERESLESQRKSLLHAREKARETFRAANEERQSLALKAHSRRASLDSLRQSLERMHTRASQLQQRFLTLSEERASRESPEKQFEGEMAALIEKRVATESRLGEERAKVQALDEKYRKKDGKRQEAIQTADEMRSKLESTRLGQQEVELRARSLAEQVAEQNGDEGPQVEEIAKEIPENANSADWAEQIESLSEKIFRLEPVNLAAIQEFEEESKRKEYLDSQDADLNDALRTLENAIAKIDKKTRTRFKETFEQVNKGVQELFPRLFGGGHAYLELTGEDLLTTGVSIMARPPGKRCEQYSPVIGWGEGPDSRVVRVFDIPAQPCTVLPAR